MGGAKKKGLAQVEKQQRRARLEKKVKPKAESKTPVKPPLEGVKDEELTEELRKMRVITPYALSSRFNIKVSSAKSILKTLADKKIIRCVGGNSRVKIYSMPSAEK